MSQIEKESASLQESLLRASRRLVAAVNRAAPASSEQFFVLTSDAQTKTQFQHLRTKIDRILAKLVDRVMATNHSSSDWRATEDALDHLYGLLEDRLREGPTKPAFALLGTKRPMEISGVGGIASARADEERLTGRSLALPFVGAMIEWEEGEGGEGGGSLEGLPEIGKLGPPEDSFEYIGSDAELEEWTERVRPQLRAIAIDLEHHNIYSYHGYTCLVQLTALLQTGETRNCIVDVLSEQVSFGRVGELLGPILGAREIPKVFHGAEQDIVWLQRDFGVRVVNMFDTGVAARLLGLSQRSLKAVIETYFPEVVVDKTHQLSDWRVRPLQADMLQYAVSDTKYLIHVWLRMHADLLRAGGGGVAVTAFGKGQLAQLFRETETLCRKTFSPVFDAESVARKLILRNGQKNHALLVNILLWRDRIARELNINWGLVLKERDLLRLVAVRSPQSPNDIVRGNFGSYVAQHAHEIFALFAGQDGETAGPPSSTGARTAAAAESRLEKTQEAASEQAANEQRREPRRGPSRLIDSFRR